MFHRKLCKNENIKSSIHSLSCVEASYKWQIPRLRARGKQQRISIKRSSGGDALISPRFKPKTSCTNSEVLNHEGYRQD